MPWRAVLTGAQWSFGDFELDVAGFQLRRAGRAVKLERIPMELLIQLVERPGQLVGRDEIAAKLWGDGVHVDSERGLNTAVSKVRAALRDSADKPAFIETVAGKGYRFIGTVSEVSGPEAAGPEPAPAAIAGPQPNRWWPIAGVAVTVAVVAAAVYFSGFRRGGAADSAMAITIAVLPFQNLSSDPEQEYFGDGLTEETIAALGRVSPSRIRVIARTSSMAYKSTRKTAAQIGAELGASHLVESSVRRDAEGVRISVKLVRVSDQVQVWSATYDRSPPRSLGVQDEIGAAIASQVGAELSPRPGENAGRRTTQYPDAQDLYLRGRYYWHQRTPEGMAKALHHFEAAIQKDPAYALAHAGLADTYILQALVSWANPVEQRTKARAAIEQALRLDPNLAEAHTAAGMASFFMDWDWAAAERSFRRAIASNPNYAVAHQFYGHLLSNSSRHNEALVEIQKAREIDPLSPMMHAGAGAYLAGAGRYDDALVRLRQALAMDPEFFPTHSVLGLLYERNGKPEAAIEEFRKAHRLSGGNILQLANQGSVLGRIGRAGEAKQILEAMHQIAQRRFVPPYTFALVYAGLGDRNATFEWLEKAYGVRDVGMIFLPVDFKWDAFRADERFKSLLRRCGFPG